MLSPTLNSLGESGGGRARKDIGGKGWDGWTRLPAVFDSKGSSDGERTKFLAKDLVWANMKGRLTSMAGSGELSWMTEGGVGSKHYLLSVMVCINKEPFLCR